MVVNRLIITVVALVIVGTPATAQSHSAAPPTHWVGSWSAAMTPAVSGTAGDGFTDTTLRQVAHLSVGGDQVRIRISNVYGDSPLVVGAVTAAPRGDVDSPTSWVEASSLVPVTFDGERSVTIAPGTERFSDAVALRVADDSDVVVSMYLPGPTGPATYHIRGLSTSFHSPGDATSDPGGAFSRLDTSRYFLAGVDVTASAPGSIVFFGDSITDGVASASDANTRYPDQVADRLLRRPEVRELGVLNVGLSGNRVLTDAGAAGDSALRRFDRDVLSQTAVRTVVLLEGINDIGASLGEVDAAEIISAYRQFIARAHNAGVDVIGGTITPYQGAVYYSEAGEADRQAINRWIRDSGEFDAVVDFDAAVRDPANPLRLLPAYDSGDQLHPNDAGFAAMASAVDLDDLTR